jgi:hypothetical protein
LAEGYKPPMRQRIGTKYERFTSTSLVMLTGSAKRFSTLLSVGLPLNSPVRNEPSRDEAALAGKQQESMRGHSGLAVCALSRDTRTSTSRSTNFHS